MVTADDVAGLVVLARLAAVTDYETILPGAAWFGRAPDGPAGYPYSVFQLEAGEAKLSSGGLYVQAWNVRLGAYAPVGATGVSPLNVQKLFHDALVTEAANTALRAIAMRNGTEKVLHGRPLAARGGEFARELREGRDVFVVGFAAEILVQGNRSVS